MLAVLLVVYSALLSVAQERVQLHVIKQWKFLNYTWPTAEFYQNATLSGQYVPENIIVAGIVSYDKWFYATMPRMKNGVPATLGRISARNKNNTAPLIAPFPSWEFNKLGNCNALQNVQNIEIDPKGQMWIIDGGHTASLTYAPIKKCFPKLIIFDIKNNLTTVTHIFGESVAAKNGSFLYDLVIDNEYGYITDNSRYDPGIIVFSRQLNRSWKIRQSKTMQADPSIQFFKVNDVFISAPINIAGIAMGPSFKNNNTNAIIKDRQIFFCPISSLHLYSTNASILQNEHNSKKELKYPGDVNDVGLKTSQTDGMIMTNQGILYYGLLSDNSIAKWDFRTSFTAEQKVVSKDSTYIQWTNSFTIDLEGNIIVLTNTLQEFIYKKLNIHQTNFWLLSGYIGEKSYLYDKFLQDYGLDTKNTTHFSINPILTDTPSDVFNTSSEKINTGQEYPIEEAPSTAQPNMLLNLQTMLMTVAFLLHVIM